MLHAADRCGGRCGGAPQAGVQNACGHMYLDEGEEMNLTRSLNNYITMASQVVRQVRRYSHSSCRGLCQRYTVRTLEHFPGQA